MKVAFIIALICTALPWSATANPIGPGSVELAGSAAFQHNAFSENLGSQTLIQLNPGVLFGVTRVLQLGAGLLFQHESFDSGGQGSSSASSIGGEGMLRLNFGTSETIRPYFGGGIGFVSWSGDGSSNSSVTVIPSATLGWRVMIQDAASLNFGLSYLYQSNVFGIEDVNANTLLLTLGFSVFPKGSGGE